MTTATATRSNPRTPALDRSVAMRLAATEYDRFTAALRRLSPEDWRKPTDCPAWDVHQMAAHTLGMAEMAASIRETRRQNKQAKRRGGVFIDALTAVQVDKHRDKTPEAIIAELERVGPRAAKSRRRTPGFLRRRRLPDEQDAGGVVELWTIGFLVDVILTRDPWMHRIDIARATGHDLELTADHDGVIVADVVAEWAERHGQPFTLRLTGPAGGEWSRGSGGPALELDAIEFCRLVSGRGRGDGLLAVQVPF